MSTRKYKKDPQQERKQSQPPSSPPVSLVAPETRDRVDAAVQAAVDAVTGNGGLGHCMMYSLAGSALLCGITGSMDYFPQGGSLHVKTLVSGMGYSYDVRDGGVAAGEFHTWITRHPPQEAERQDVGDGFHTYDGTDSEVIDFTARHYRRTAELSGLVWDVPDPPPYLWTTWRAAQAQGIALEADEAASRLILRAMLDMETPTRALIRLAFGFYHGRLESGSAKANALAQMAMPGRPAGSGWRLHASDSAGRLWVRE